MASSVCVRCQPDDSAADPSWWEKIQELAPNGVGNRIRDTLLLYAFRGTLLVVSVAILVNVAPSTYQVINDAARSFLQKAWNLCVVALALSYLFSEIMIPAYRQPRTRRHAILFTVVVGFYLGYKMLFGA
jgi:hypothetical protein